MRTSYDNHGRLVWWIDLGRLDMPRLRELPVIESFRAMVWFSHAVMYDDMAQGNGMVMCETLGRSMWPDAPLRTRRSLASPPRRLALISCPFHP